MYIEHLVIFRTHKTVVIVPYFQLVIVAFYLIIWTIRRRIPWLSMRIRLDYVRGLGV